MSKSEQESKIQQLQKTALEFERQSSGSQEPVIPSISIPADCLIYKRLIVLQLSKILVAMNPIPRRNRLMLSFGLDDHPSDRLLAQSPFPTCIILFPNNAFNVHYTFAFSICFLQRPFSPRIRPRWVYGGYRGSSSALINDYFAQRLPRDVTPHQEKNCVYWREEKKCNADGMGWEPHGVLLLLLLLPYSLHFCGSKKRKVNVYDRISRVVFANVQHGERCPSCRDSPMLIVCQRAVAWNKKNNQPPKLRNRWWRLTGRDPISFHLQVEGRWMIMLPKTSKLLVPGSSPLSSTLQLSSRFCVKATEVHYSSFRLEVLAQSALPNVYPYVPKKPVWRIFFIV